IAVYFPSLLSPSLAFPLFPYTTLFRSGLSGTVRRRDPCRRAAGVVEGAHAAARTAQHVDDLPELRAVAAHDGDGKHRLRLAPPRSEEHTSELQSPDHLVCRLLLEKKKT